MVLVAAVFALIAALAALDLHSDLQEGATLPHALTEGLIVLVGSMSAVVLARRFVKLRQREREALVELKGLQLELQRSKADSKKWQAKAQDLLAGLGELIDQQLEQWGLTRAEKAVALLLLKGLSHKEVASLRKVSEATARQQAASIYRKAGLSGRHDLAAFFLEDLLTPRSNDDAGSNTK